MKASFPLIVLALLSIINCSCKNSPTQAKDSSAIDFPNKVGDTWTYIHFDSLYRKLDTAFVTIVGQTTMGSNQAATIWQFKSSEGVDTNYVVVSDNAVYFGGGVSDDTVLYALSAIVYRLIFPLKVGNEWSGGYFNDTDRVVNISSIAVAAGNFSTAYEVVETWGLGFNQDWSISRWFVPGVGIVRIYYHGVTPGMANETYELIRYTATR